MTAVLRLFWNICLLRCGPEAVPTQTWFLGALIVTYLVACMFLNALVNPGTSPLLALNIALIGLTITAAVTWFALHIRQYEDRFPATLGALVGTKLVIVAAMSVGHGITSGLVQSGVGWALTVWSIVVVGFVLHRALACKLGFGILLSFAIAIAGVVVYLAVLGPAISADRGVALG